MRVRGSAKNLGPLFEGLNKVLLLGKVPLVPAGIFSAGGGEARSTKGGFVREVAAWGSGGPPDAGEVFKNFVKNEKFTIS